MSLQDSIERLESWRAEYGNSNADHYPCVKWPDVRALLDDRAQWQAVLWAVARELNCLPSTFSDGNAHVLQAAINLNSDLASHADALGGLVSAVAGVDEELSETAWQALEMARHVLGREALSESEAKP